MRFIQFCLRSFDLEVLIANLTDFRLFLLIFRVDKNNMKYGLDLNERFLNFIRSAKAVNPEIENLIIAEAKKGFQTVLRSGHPANINQGSY